MRQRLYNYGLDGPLACRGRAHVAPMKLSNRVRTESGSDACGSAPDTVFRAGHLAQRTEVAKRNAERGGLARNLTRTYHTVSKGDKNYFEIRPELIVDSP